ncbi:aminoglycoside phosphotransferase (APT) family kinase protein [Catenulispora sp. GAS73]|uniref:phosphotransferase n=1 Tax=Catenulispora sp. GAS73 TaxID=3156269 RepID=UPI003512495E
MSVNPFPAHEDRDLQATERVVASINHTHGTDFVLDHRLKGGFQNGAYALRAGAAPELTAVLKWTADANRAGLIQRAQPVVVAARAAGWPTPAWLMAGSTPSGYPYQVQEIAEGTHPERVTRNLVQAALPVLDVQAGLRPETDQDWSAYDHAVVFADESGFSSTLAAYSPAGAEFVETMRRWVAPHRGAELCTTDLVHGDLNPSNIFLVDGRISALVDAEALGKGSRFHDLATLLTYAHLWDGGEPGVCDDLLAYARRHAAPGELEVSFASCLLGLLAFVADRNPGDSDGRADVDTQIRTATGLLRPPH